MTNIWHVLVFKTRKKWQVDIQIWQNIIYFTLQLPVINNENDRNVYVNISEFFLIYSYTYCITNQNFVCKTFSERWTLFFFNRFSELLHLLWTKWGVVSPRFWLPPYRVVQTMPKSMHKVLFLFLFMPG